MASLFGRSLRVFIPAAALLSFAVLAAAMYGMDAMYGAVMEENLGQTIGALEAGLPPEAASWFGGSAAEGGRWATALDRSSGFRVTLVAPDGRVVADSRSDPRTMENHGDRPEVRKALGGETGFARRRSTTLWRELFYAARPVPSVDSRRIAGVLRIAVDLPSLRGRLAPARDYFIASVLLVGLLAAAGAALFSRGIASPLRRLATASTALGRPRAEGGDEEALAELRTAASSHRVPDEVATLASSLVTMVAEIESRDEAELRAGRERAAILDGMTEAVLALDSGLDVRMANRAARELFRIGEGRIPGLSLPGTIDSEELAGLAFDAIAAGTALERDLGLGRGGEERWFKAVAAPFGGGDGRPAGVVLVLNDITRIVRLERVRKDFVANVSHELRTPVQLIKGFTEELAALGPGEEERAGRYVGIIARNAARMENLIEDLLALARLEQDGASGPERREEEVPALVAEAVAAIEPRADAKGIRIAVNQGRPSPARLHGGLVVQALVNLLDNAVRYAAPDTEVTVEARDEGGSLLLEVLDRGPGIPDRDLPRLFERFYTVDRARSRELGGTGLGLAIVRHIALVHGGEAGAENREGGGARFWLLLPRA